MVSQSVSARSDRFAAYPQRDVLRDGTRVRIGALLPQDREAVAEGYLGLSPESKRNRFLSATPELSSSMLERLVDDVDGIDHVALVAFVQEGNRLQPVGIGRMVRYPGMPDTADIAFTVKDEWHGRGIATILAQRLCEHAPLGITHLLTEVAADNPAPLKILGKLGEMQVHRAGGGILDVEVALSGQHLRLTPPAEGERLHPLLADYARQILRMRDLVCDELRAMPAMQWPSMQWTALQLSAMQWPGMHWLAELTDDDREGEKSGPDLADAGAAAEGSPGEPDEQS